MPGDDGTWNTGIVAYTLQVTSSGGQPALTASAELVVVNRQASPFGAGWWLAGLEQLFSLGGGRMMLVGGDGTVRIYTGSGSTYLASNPARPDTLSWTGSMWVRRAGNGVEVQFSTGLQHVATRDRLGYYTYFDWSGTQLLQVRVPTTGGHLTYGLSYPNGLLGPITAPDGRVVTLYQLYPRLDSIRDPDNNRVRFGYGTGLDQYRVVSRTDRRGKVTSFSWDAASRLSQVTRPLAITTYLAPSEARGFSTAQPLDSAFTQINGPRSDVTDVTRFWVNGFGSPTRIRAATGEETRVVYNATFQALAESTVTASGLRTRAWYNTRGLTDSVRVYNPNGDGQNATTRYRWHNSYTFAISARSPTNLLDTMGYDANGNRTFQQRGTDIARRVTFAYNAAKLLESVTAPLSGPENVYYNALGNPHRTTSPLGITTLFYGDALGRDTLVVTPRGTGIQATDSATVYATGLRQYSHYDVMDRVWRTRQVGSPVSVPVARTSGPDTIRVDNAFDAEGNVLTVNRYHSTDGGPVYGASGEQYGYDDAGRVTSQQRGSAGWTTFTLDPAGNATSTLTPRGFTISAQFDAANRLTRRVVPQVYYGQSWCLTSAFHGFPCWFTFPTRDGPDLCIGADTAYFHYDAAGNLRRAENGYAWVRRTYTPSGALLGDTLLTRTYSTRAPNPCGGGDDHAGARVDLDFAYHVYGLRVAYDLEGRRSTVYHPDQLDACTGACTTLYHYNGVTGALDSLRGPLGHPTRFQFDVAGRLVTTTHPGGAALTVAYDADSRVASRLGPQTQDVLQYNGAGKAIQLDGLVAGQLRTVTTAYTALGAVGYIEGHSVTAGYEEFALDALGNRQWILDNALDPVYSARQRVHTYTPSGQLTNVALGSCPPGPYCPTWYGYERNFSFDGAGNGSAMYGYERRDQSQGATYDETRSYYGADERLMVHNRQVGISIHSAPGGVYEEYRYDPLGRRVMVRSRTTSNSPCNPVSGYQCGSYLERTVWDGDQVFYEVRTRGADDTDFGYLEAEGVQGLPGEGASLGIVASIHAGGIDQPVQLIRTGAEGFGTVLVVPWANWQGDYAYGTDASGQVCQAQSTCPAAPWSGDRLTADGAPAQGGSYGFSPSWLGYAVGNRTDGSGLQYLRNRYYDPSSGRFTQQDPIGLAGGLNLYGFAGGDPVNFSDPFGLCPEYLTGRPCQNVLGGQALTLRTSAANPRIGQFGMVRNGGRRAHQGNDILAAEGTGVTAADRGTVIFAGRNGGYGNQVVIAHQNADGETVSFTTYSHLNSIDVRRGATVDAGAAIGTVGRTGNADDPDIPTHLHFEILTAYPAGKGLSNRVDPQQHLPK